MNSTMQQTRVLPGIPPLAEDATWCAIAPRDRHRIECEHFYECGEDATWTTRQGTLFVCDYHRLTSEIQRRAVQNPDFIARVEREFASRISA